MDKKKGVLNVVVSVGLKILILVATVLARRLLIMYLGSEINGLNNLFINIIGFLAVADLGIGSAIIFCMYRPIVEGNTEAVAALYRLYRKVYLIVGMVVLAVGMVIVPFLPALAKDYSMPVGEMRISFVLMLVSVVMTYFFSADISIIDAHKDTYITSVFSSVSMLVKSGLQIGAVLVFKSFYAYLICRIVAEAVHWIITVIYVKRRYGTVISMKTTLDKETKTEVSKNVRAMFMHKIGVLLVNSGDSVIISAFIGVVTLGGYSNYTSIVVSMVAILVMFFTPLTAVVGHLFAEEKQALSKYFNFFHMFNYLLGVLFFLGYYAIINNLVVMFYGADMELPRAISFIITYNYFVQFMRNAVVLFRDATGTFYYDRWKALIEGVVNVILSIAFVLIFPDEFKVVGVIVATIITTLFISHIVEPYVLFKHALERPVRGYYLKNFALIAIFAGLLFGLDRLMVSNGSEIVELLINGLISVGITLVVSLICLGVDKDFRFYSLKLLKKGKNKITQNSENA